jgi:hypothetical protein
MPGRPAFFDCIKSFFEALPGDIPYGVEVRNPHWIDTEWFGFLSNTVYHQCSCKGTGWMILLRSCLGTVPSSKDGLVCGYMEKIEKEWRNERGKSGTW